MNLLGNKPRKENGEQVLGEIAYAFPEMNGPIYDRFKYLLNFFNEVIAKVVSFGIVPRSPVVQIALRVISQS